VASVEPLRSSEAIYFLNLRNNDIESLEPLVGIENLGTLIVDDNPLRCDETLWASQSDIVTQLELSGTWVLATCSPG
jgi:hypothetical protein